MQWHLLGVTMDLVRIGGKGKDANRRGMCGGGGGVGQILPRRVEQMQQRRIARIAIEASCPSHR
jgi:hypothetical protein